MASILSIGPQAPAASPAAGNGFGLGSGTGAMLAYLTSLFKPSLNQPGLAPLTPGQLKSQATGYVTDTINPQLAALQNTNAAATAGGVGSIRGGTTNYANELAPIAGQVGDIGKEQSQETQAETDALASFLKGSGASTFNDVAAKTDAAGIGTPAPANMGAGAAGISAATGLAATHDATNEGANNEKLAALLPGFARLSGQQAENQFRSTQQGNLNTQVGSLEGQVPGLVQNVEQNLQGNEITKANDRAGNAGTAASALGTFLGNAADRKTQIDLANLSGLFGVQKAGAAASLPDPALSAKAGIIVDHTNTPILDANGKEQPILGTHLDPKTGQPVKDITASQEAKQDLHGLSQSQVDKLNGEALQIAQGALIGGQYNAQGQKAPNGGYTLDKTGKKVIPAPPLDKASLANHYDQLGIPPWIYQPIIADVYTAGGKHSAIAGPPAPKGK